MAPMLRSSPLFDNGHFNQGIDVAGSGDAAAAGWGFV